MEELYVLNISPDDILNKRSTGNLTNGYIVGLHRIVEMSPALTHANMADFLGLDRSLTHALQSKIYRLLSKKKKLRGKHLKHMLEHPFELPRHVQPQPTSMYMKMKDQLKMSQTELLKWKNTAEHEKQVAENAFAERKHMKRKINLLEINCGEKRRKIESLQERVKGHDKVATAVMEKKRQWKKLVLVLKKNMPNFLRNTNP